MLRLAFAAVLAMTLANAATAQTSRIRQEGEMCGGFVGFTCAKGLWCDPAPGQCQVADVSGTCTAEGAMCPTIYQPVCGCDRRTYGNDCERRRVKVAKDHDRECAK